MKAGLTWDEVKQWRESLPPIDDWYLHGMRKILLHGEYRIKVTIGDDKLPRIEEI